MLVPTVLLVRLPFWCTTIVRAADYVVERVVESDIPWNDSGKSPNDAPRWFGGRHLKSGDWSPLPRAPTSGGFHPGSWCSVIVVIVAGDRIHRTSTALGLETLSEFKSYPPSVPLPPHRRTASARGRPLFPLYFPTSSL